MKNKFKPSRCVICFNRVRDFDRELLKVISESDEWKQYNENVKEVKKREETTKAFKNSEVLVCHNTLIVSDENWKLVDDHLINTNYAGYLLIDKCQIKKD